jgi:hypothetical protein
MGPAGADLATPEGAERAGEGRPVEGGQLAKLLMRKG